jgi:hypothetical protein
LDKNTVHNLLKDYGCPSGYSGYAQLLDLIIIASGYSRNVKRNLKTIYHDATKLHATTRLCIERNLRTLVTAWSKKSKFRELFDEPPTNAELIVLLIDLLHYNELPEHRTIYDLLLADI